jgi:hypothetical protein
MHYWVHQKMSLVLKVLAVKFTDEEIEAASLRFIVAKFVVNGMKDKEGVKIPGKFKHNMSFCVHDEVMDMLLIMEVDLYWYGPYQKWSLRMDTFTQSLWQ